MESLVKGLAPLPADARQSITFDRGTEFSAWQQLKDGIGADAWFCGPKVPYQKGTVECLGYRTPAEVFESKLVEIQNRLD